MADPEWVVIAKRIRDAATPAMKRLGWGRLDDLGIYDDADPEVVICAQAFALDKEPIPKAALEDLKTYRNQWLEDYNVKRFDDVLPELVAA